MHSERIPASVVSADPEAAASRALGALSAASIVIHIDVDVLDFLQYPPPTSRRTDEDSPSKTSPPFSGYSSPTRAAPACSSWSTTPITTHSARRSTARRDDASHSQRVTR